MADVAIIRLNPVIDLARVTDLCMRAADYVRFETGKDPDATYAATQLSGGPPHAEAFNHGLERPDGTLVGMINCIRHHPEPDEWYMGLLLLDPAARKQGVGRRAVRHVFDLAAQMGGRQIRIAVVDANVIGRAFWEAMGFAFERFVPGDKTSHGKACNVLIRQLGGSDAA